MASELDLLRHAVGLVGEHAPIVRLLAGSAAAEASAAWSACPAVQRSLSPATALAVALPLLVPAGLTLLRYVQHTRGSGGGAAPAAASTSPTIASKTDDNNDNDNDNDDISPRDGANAPLLVQARALMLALPLLCTLKLLSAVLVLVFGSRGGGTMRSGGGDGVGVGVGSGSETAVLAQLLLLGPTELAALATIKLRATLGRRGRRRSWAELLLQCALPVASLSGACLVWGGAAAAAAAATATSSATPGLSAASTSASTVALRLLPTLLQLCAGVSAGLAAYASASLASQAHEVDATNASSARELRELQRLRYLAEQREREHRASLPLVEQIRILIERQPRKKGSVAIDLPRLAHKIDICVVSSSGHRRTILERPPAERETRVVMRDVLLTLCACTRQFSLPELRDVALHYATRFNIVEHQSDLYVVELLQLNTPSLPAAASLATIMSGAAAAAAAAAGTATTTSAGTAATTATSAAAVPSLQVSAPAGDTTPLAEQDSSSAPVPASSLSTTTSMATTSVSAITSTALGVSLLATSSDFDGSAPPSLSSSAATLPVPLSFAAGLNMSGSTLGLRSTSVLSGSLDLLVDKYLEEILHDEECSAVWLLKAINQGALAPGVLLLKLSVGMLLPYRDVRGEWFVNVEFDPLAGVTVQHTKSEQSVASGSDTFRFVWSLTLCFSVDCRHVNSAAVHIEELWINPDASAAFRDRVQRAFAEYMR